MRAWQQLPKLRDPDKFDGWVYRLLVNACADQGRQLRRWSERVRPVSIDASVGDETGSVADREQLELGIPSTEARAAGSRRPSPLQRVLDRGDRANARHPRGDRQIETSLRDRGDACGSRSRRAGARGRREQDRVMTQDVQFDDTVSKWLEETAPARLPEQVLSATFERTRRSRQHRGWRALLGGSSMPRFVPALGSAAVVAGGRRSGGDLLCQSAGPRRRTQPLLPRHLDLDLGHRREHSDDDHRSLGRGAVEIVGHDDSASVCSGAPSTMTGTGRIERRTSW